MKGALNLQRPGPEIKSNQYCLRFTQDPEMYKDAYELHRYIKIHI